MEPDCFIPRRTGVTNPAAERRKAGIPRGRLRRLRKLVCGGMRRARARTWLDASRRSAPSLCASGKQRTSEEPMPREKEEARAEFTPPSFRGAAKRRARKI